jgi:hypothetical protein
MARNPHDLTGQWHGTYTYPAQSGPPTPFIARLLDEHGAISGLIFEPEMLVSGETITAVVEGHRAGRSVDFTKTYQNSLPDYENPIDYVGQLSANGNEVRGVWSLLEWNGAFEMYREPEIEQAVTENVAIEEPVGGES